MLKICVINLVAVGLFLGTALASTGEKFNRTDCLIYKKQVDGEALLTQEGTSNDGSTKTVTKPTSGQR